MLIKPTATMKLLTAVAITTLCVAAASADTIYFSGASSDSTDPALLDAHVDWSFNSGTNQLTLNIFNDTTTPAYTISEFLFNTSSDVGGFSVASYTGPDSGSLSPTITANPGGQSGFGNFDWDLDLANGNDGITSGNSLLVVLNVTPSSGATLDMADFFDHLSVVGQTETGVAAMHFTRGPGDDSAWTIPGDPVVPEPATVILFGFGIAGLLARRRLLA